MSKWVRIGALSGLVAAIVALFALFGYRSRTGAELQRYKVELRAKGEKLTFAELTAGRSLKPDTSTATLTNAATQLRSRLLSPGHLEYMQFDRSSGRAPAAARLPAPPSDRAPLSWEELGAEIRAVTEPLEQIHQVLKDPPPDMGPRSNLFSLVGPFVTLRTVAQWLGAATLNDLHQGDVAKALGHLQDLCGLVQWHREEPTLVSQMIRVAIAGLALSVTWEALQIPGWSEPQLRQLQSDWENIDLSLAVEKGFVGERVGVEELFAQIRASTGKQTRNRFASTRAIGVMGLFEDYVLLPAYKASSINDDELFYLQIIQGALDVVRLRGRSWPELNRLQATNMARLSTIAGPLQRYQFWCSNLSIPGFQKALLVTLRNETQRQMMVTAIALKRYQMDHGRFPENLNALIPQYLGGLPRDYMSGQPLCYRLKADGTPLLYSVGEDGRDDGGDATAMQPANPASVWWSGLDAVWPEASPAP